jgi:hypothetical protein
VSFSPQRNDDWSFPFHVRPVAVEVDARRLTITAHEAQLLMGELGRLPGARHRAAEETAAAVMHGLAANHAIVLDEDGRRCMLRAVEGLRAGGPLTTGVAKLRVALLRAHAAVL